jgi:hypothetical protein
MLERKVLLMFFQAPTYGSPSEDMLELLGNDVYVA